MHCVIVYPSLELSVCLLEKEGRCEEEEESGGERERRRKKGRCDRGGVGMEGKEDVRGEG